MWSSCTIQDPLYCDEQILCPKGQRCDIKSRTCVSLEADAGFDHGTRIDSDFLVLPDGGLALPNGASCAQDDHCENKICADGVCCRSRCEGLCRSCALEGTRGECTLASEGNDPRQDCAGSHAACAGRCDGHGACTFAPEKTPCEAASCQDGELTLSLCNREGTCIEQTHSCGGYACDASGANCRQSCSTSKDCTGTAQCVGEDCTDNLPLGVACGENDLACDSKHCVDNVCCQTDSCAPCHVCNLSQPVGQCASLVDGITCGSPSCSEGTQSLLLCTSGSCEVQALSCNPYACNVSGVDCLSACGQPQDCASEAYCESTHCLPKKENGLTCADNQECLSNICTDTEHVCCNSACTGECSTCAGLNQCTPQPDNTPCGSLTPICDDGPESSLVKIEQCDGNYNCVAETTAICDPFRCSIQGGVAACNTSCAAAADCTTRLCDLVDVEGTCVLANQICYATPAGSATCPGDGSRIDPHCAIQLCLNSQRAYIALADGTYPENLIAKGDVHLIATGTVSGASPLVKIIPSSSNADGIDLTGGYTVYLYGLDLNFPAPSVPPLASDPGGPLIHSDNQAEVILKASRVHRGNKAPCLLTKSSTLTLTDVTVDTCGNRGLSSEASELTLNNVLLSQNKEYGIYHDGGSLTMEDVTFRNNSGVSLKTFSSILDLDRIRAYANDDLVFSLNNSTTGIIANMLAYDNEGSTLFFSNNATPPLILHLTSVKNTGVEISCDGATDIYNSILWDSDAVMYNGNCLFHASAVKNGVGGLDNISVDPQFNSSSSEPYSLSGTSPCIDTASGTVPLVGTYPPLDVAGNPRQVDFVPGGRVYDMGAFELQ